MKKRMKKIGCLLLAFTMSYQTVALASELPSEQVSGKNEASETVSNAEEAAGVPKNSEEQQNPAVNNTGDESREADVLPPQMGWSSWNFFKQNINEEKITAVEMPLWIPG